MFYPQVVHYTITVSAQVSCYDEQNDNSKGQTRF